MPDLHLDEQLRRDPQLRAALEQLLEARRAAEALKLDVWSLAVEMPGLLVAGCTTTHLRLLEGAGYVEHAEEVTKHSDGARSFRPESRMKFGPQTCLVLTEAGVHFLAADSPSGRGNGGRLNGHEDTMEAANPHRITERPDSVDATGEAGGAGPVVPSSRSLTAETTTPRGAAWASAFVWSVWALMVLAALAFSWRYALPVPWGDDWWGIVPVLAGSQPVTLDWLWDPYNGAHRIALPRLLYLSLLALTGYDFRAAAFFNAFTLSALAASLIWAARRVRGRSICADALFPLALLHWGHNINLYSSWQITVVPPVAIAGGVLLLLVRYDTHSTFRTAFLTGICLVLLMLCGAPWIPYALTLAPWLGYVGVRQFLLPQHLAGLKGCLLLTLVAAICLLVYLYFYLPGMVYLRTTWWDKGEGMIQCLSLGFGPFGPRITWSYGDSRVMSCWVVLGLGVLLLALLSGARLLAVWYKQPAERVRALALLFFLAGAGGAALSIGFARAGEGWPAVFTRARYCILVVPLLLCVYSVWETYGPPNFRRAIQSGLFLLMSISLPLNMSLAPDAWPESDESFQVFGKAHQFGRDLRAGIPASTLVAQYVSADSGPDNDNMIYDAIIALHRNHIGLFRYLREDPPLLELPLPHEIMADSVVTLPEPRFVYAIRLEHRSSDPTVPVPVRLFWKRSDHEDWNEHSANIYLEGAEGQTSKIWVLDTVAQLRLDLGKDAQLSSLKVALVVPETDRPEAAR